MGLAPSVAHQHRSVLDENVASGPRSRASDGWDGA